MESFLFQEKKKPKFSVEDRVRICKFKVTFEKRFKTKLDGRNLRGEESCAHFSSDV